MALILFANTKGGSGKTTAALVFANEVVKHNAKVAMFEGDPNAPLTRWARNRGIPVIIGEDERPKDVSQAIKSIESATSSSSRIILIQDSSEERVFDWIEAGTTWANIVVADPEGSPNQWLQDVALSAD